MTVRHVKRPCRPFPGRDRKPGHPLAGLSGGLKSGETSAVAARAMCGWHGVCRLVILRAYRTPALIALPGRTVNVGAQVTALQIAVSGIYSANGALQCPQ